MQTIKTLLEKTDTEIENFKSRTKHLQEVIERNQKEIKLISNEIKLRENLISFLGVQLAGFEFAESCTGGSEC